jgi:ERCC4-type nuclease
LVIAIDTRERYGYRFAGRQVTVHKQALRCGDYALLDENGAIQAAVERKTLEDLTSSLVDGSLQFALGDLAELERAVVVIEAGYADSDGVRSRSPRASPGPLPRGSAGLRGITKVGRGIHLPFHRGRGRR